MFIPEKMTHLQALLPATDLDAAAEAVIRDGSLQIVDAADVEPWAGELSAYGAEEEPETLRARREKIEGRIKDLGLETKFEGLAPQTEPWEAVDGRLSELGAEIDSVKAERERLVKELNRLETLKAKWGGLPGLGISLEGQQAYSYLAVRTGRVSDKNLDILNRKLEGVLHLLVPAGSARGKTLFVVSALKRDAEALDAALAEAGFETVEWSGDAAFEDLKNADAAASGLQDGIRGADDRLKEIGRDRGAFLLSALFRLRKERLTHRILRHFRKTDHTVLLSGWVPTGQREGLVKELRSATGGRCVVREIPAESLDSVREGRVQVPVRLKNHWFFRPFEMLVSLYGTPSYQSLDPTPLVGISYVVMFGIMFGDLGHGLVLALLGGLMMAKLKAGMKDSGRLILYAGLSSMFFGLCFGSVFGYEEVIPHIWFSPMQSMNRLMGTLIYFGMGMVTVSVLLNVAVHVRKKKLLEAVFNRAGITGLIVYWCGIVLALNMFAGGSGGGSLKWFMRVLVGAVALIAFQEPVLRLLKGKKGLYHEPGVEGIFSGVLEGAVEVLETFIGFLSNTLSFIRVAAFSLAHAALCMAVFTIAEPLRGAAGGSLSIGVIIFGNVGIIVMEGLSAGIQSLRLEFYEFFNRFFEDGNMPYKPVRTELGEG
jgi:V/A-type H+/Na+-transporting ATPase subunit I